MEALRLLVGHNGKLTQVLLTNGEHFIRVVSQLLLAVGHKGDGEDGQQHPLIAGTQIVQKVVGLLALELHVIGRL